MLALARFAFQAWSFDQIAPRPNRDLQREVQRFRRPLYIRRQVSGQLLSREESRTLCSVWVLRLLKVQLGT